MNSASLTSIHAQAFKTPAKTRVKKSAKDIVAFTPEEQAKLKVILRQHKHIAYYAMELMLETGMRVGETLALSWADTNFQRKSIHVHATVVNPASNEKSYIQEGAKSESSNRIIPISPNAIIILEMLKEINGNEEFVFIGSRGTRLSYELLRQQCKKVCDEAQVNYLGLHVWRHTFATNLYYKGVDIKVLSKLLGHANTTITYNIYIHLYGDGFDDMLKAVG